jgi:RNA polymerase sigma-70 factor (ECF subfamily)
MAALFSQGDGRFPTTEWTLVARLRHDDPAVSTRALDDLCTQYHYPLYCYLRRRGLAHHDAEDALHDFMARLLRLDSFGMADAEKGRLRTFLLVALQRYLINWRRDALRHRDREMSADAEAAIAAAEGRFQREETGHSESPDRLYDRQWAQELMNLVLLRLRAKYAAKKKERLFDTLRPVLLNGGSLHGFDSTRMAEELGMRSGALRTALMRLLEDYREALRHEILQTVENKDMAREELQALAVLFKQE